MYSKDSLENQLRYGKFQAEERVLDIQQKQVGTKAHESSIFPDPPALVLDRVSIYVLLFLPLESNIFLLNSSYSLLALSL